MFWKDSTFLLQRVNLLRSSVLPDAAKTTVLKMINGLIEPTSGDIFVDGSNILDKNLTELRRNIGYAIQGSVLFPHMTVEQNISYVPNLINRKIRKRPSLQFPNG